MVWKEFLYLGTPYENVENDILEVSKYIIKNNGSTSPAFFENMMSCQEKKTSDSGGQCEFRNEKNSEKWNPVT